MGRIDTYPQSAILQPNSPVTLAYAQIVANQTTVAGDIVGLQVSAVIPEGRRIRITGYVAEFQNTTANAGGFLRIFDGGTQLTQSDFMISTASTAAGVTASAVVTPSAGLHTYKLTGGVQNGGVANVLASTTSPAYILVEDITGMPLVTAPGSVPVGQIGYAQATANQGSITTEVDLTGLSVNVSVAAGRIIRITGYVPAFSSTVAGDAGRISIKEGATLVTLGQAFISGTAAGANTIMPQVVLSPSAGSHTYKLTGVRVSGSGTFTMNADPTFPAYILVEDITATPAAGSGAPSSTLGYSEVLTSQAGITTVTDITGLSVTVTVPSGRRLRIVTKLEVQSSVNNDYAAISIKEGATRLTAAAVNIGPAATNGSTNEVSVIVSPSAGTHTYKTTLERLAGTGSLTNAASATDPSHILVEDITGSVWPSSAQVTSGLIASEAWTPYTPTWVSSGTAVSLGNGTLLGRYIKIGRTVIGAIYFSPGSTSTFGTGTYVWSLPVAPSNSIFSFQIIGDAKGYNGGANCNAVATINGSGQFVRAIYSATWPAGAETQFGQLTPWTWVSGNDLTINFTYESAT